jgi:hypothetical protein
MKYKYVYFFRQNNVNAVKIGLTNDIKKRFTVFTTYAPYGAVNIGYICSENAQNLEKQIHKEFSGEKINREWFLLSDLTIRDIIDKHDGVLLHDINIDTINYGLNTKKTEQIKTLIKMGYKQNEIALKLKTPASYVSKVNKLHKKYLL